jgi:hypothetical protein
MSRVKTFDSTGLATSGRLYAGDLNGIQDQYADLYNLAQSHGVGSIALGEAGLQFVRFGPGEARITGALRTDGIVRGLGGLYGGSFNNTTRDAIPSTFAPTGLIILNTSTGRHETNYGTDATRQWKGLDSAIAVGLLGAIPAPAPSNMSTFYFATDDNGGTLYFSNGAAWTKVARGLTQAITAGMIPNGLITDAMLAGSITPSKVTGTAVITTDTRLSDARPPTAGSVTAVAMAASSVSSANIIDGTIVDGDVAADTLTARVIAPGAIGVSELATDSVTATAIAANAVGASELADNSVDAAAILASVISFGKLDPTLQTIINNKLDAGAAYQVKFGNNIVTTNGSGQASISFPTPFANASDFIIGINADPAAGGGWYPVIAVYGGSNAFTFNAYAAGGSPLASTTVRILWMAIGH